MSRWSYSRRTALPEEDEVFDPNGKYTKAQLEAWANKFLKDDAAKEDPETGKRRGIKGENPILFPEHEHARRRREIICAEGVPDPSIVQGIYNRSHADGRALSSPESRAQGAPFYKG